MKRFSILMICTILVLSLSTTTAIASYLPDTPLRITELVFGPLPKEVWEAYDEMNKNQTDGQTNTQTNTQPNAQTNTQQSTTQTNSPVKPVQPVQDFNGEVNNSFPTKVIRDTRSIRNSFNGTEIELFGIASSQGCTMRSSMAIRDNTKIGTLHAYETIYIYFSVYDSSGREWYYVVNKSGLEGFAVASRIQIK